jgi:hypothetical protein
MLAGLRIVYIKLITDVNIKFPSKADIPPWTSKFHPNTAISTPI